MLRERITGDFFDVFCPQDVMLHASNKHTRMDNIIMLRNRKDGKIVHVTMEEYSSLSYEFVDPAEAEELGFFNQSKD